MPGRMVDAFPAAGEEDGAASGQGPGGGRGVLEGAFAVLRELARRGESGLTELAAATGLPKATTHRLLDQLVGLGMAHRGTGGRYRVGARAFCLGQGWQPAPVLRAAAALPIRRLAAATGDSVSLTVMDAGELLVVVGTSGRCDEVFPLRPGVVLPVGSAAEAVIAAARPDAAAVSAVSADAEWTGRVRRARDEGHALDLEMTVEPVACAAAPVYAPGGVVVAAIGVTVLERHRPQSLVDAVRDTAGRISANLARIPGAGRTLFPLASTTAR